MTRIALIGAGRMGRVHLRAPAATPEVEPAAAVEPFRLDTLDPEARSRLTTAYTVANFLGGTALSAATSALYATSGSGSVCMSAPSPQPSDWFSGS